MYISYMCKIFVTVMMACWHVCVSEIKHKTFIINFRTLLILSILDACMLICVHEKRGHI